MAALFSLVGGAAVNALAFSGLNYFFSKLSDSKEKKRHDLASEKLESDRDSWNQSRSQRIDYINQQLKLQGHAEKTFRDVEDAMHQYYNLTGTLLDPLPPEPHLYDYLDEEQTESIKNGELALIGVGMVATGVLVYNFV